MKNLILALTFALSTPAFAQDVSKQQAAEALVKDLYTTQKRLINPFQTSETCMGNKCSRKIDKLRKNPKYLDLSTLFSENLKKRCETNPTVCQMIFLTVSYDKQTIEMGSFTPVVTAKATSANSFDVDMRYAEMESSGGLVFKVVCESQCVLDGLGAAQ